MIDVQKLSARQRAHFLGVVEAASKSLRQADIAREAGISPSQVSRILRTEEAMEMVEGLRAKAMAESWINFQELLNLAIQNLNHCLKSPLVHSSTKAKISMNLLQIALNAGTAGDDKDASPITIIIGDQSGTATNPDHGRHCVYSEIQVEGRLQPENDDNVHHMETEVSQ